MANIQSILRDLRSTETEIQNYPGVSKFEFKETDDLGNRARVVYQGRDLPPQVGKLLSRSDSTIVSFHTEAPISIKLSIRPTPYYEQD